MGATYILNDYSENYDHNVFFAVPVMGQMDPRVSFFWLHLQRVLKKDNIGMTFCLLANDCHVDDARNRLVSLFLETECDNLFFLDADVIAENPEDILELIRSGEHIIGGVYPFKNDDPQATMYPVSHFEGNVITDDRGYIAVDGAPTGCLKISRHVLKRMNYDAPVYYGKADANHEHPIPVIFERSLDTENEVRVGGDIGFCRLWNEKYGGKIWINPDMNFIHMGAKDYSGNYSSALVDKSGQPHPRFIDAARHFYLNGDIGSIREMESLWGNGLWSFGDTANNLVCGLIDELDDKCNIVEFGSGLSSIIMAIHSCDKGGTVWSLESDVKYYDKLCAYKYFLDIQNLNVVYAPIDIQSRWYDVPSISLPHKWDMTVMDGPSRSTGNRDGFMDAGYLDKIKSSVIAVDDTDIEHLRTHNHPICTTDMREYITGARRLVVIYPEKKECPNG